MIVSIPTIRIDSPLVKKSCSQSYTFPLTSILGFQPIMELPREYHPSNHFQIPLDPMWQYVIPNETLYQPLKVFQ